MRTAILFLMATGSSIMFCVQVRTVCNVTFVLVVLGGALGWVLPRVSVTAAVMEHEMGHGAAAYLLRGKQVLAMGFRVRGTVASGECVTEGIPESRFLRCVEALSPWCLPSFPFGAAVISLALAPWAVPLGKILAGFLWRGHLKLLVDSISPAQPDFGVDKTGMPFRDVVLTIISGQSLGGTAILAVLG